MHNVPNHVAIIPDGNRRWAKARGLAPWAGHQAGAENTVKLLAEVDRLGIDYLTLWIASRDNLAKRPQEEVGFLCRIFADYFMRLSKDPKIHEKGVKVRAYGPLEELFPEDVVRAVRTAEEGTRHYEKYQISFLMGYDGRAEMVAAVKKITENAAAADHTVPITEELIVSSLWTHDLPPVDLVIRTGIDDAPHWSGGFLMWQTSYSQLYFTNTYYPDFLPKDLRAAVENYSERERRLGT